MEFASSACRREACHVAKFRVVTLFEVEESLISTMVHCCNFSRLHVFCSYLEVRSTYRQNVPRVSFSLRSKLPRGGGIFSILFPHNPPPPLLSESQQSPPPLTAVLRSHHHGQGRQASRQKANAGELAPLLVPFPFRCPLQRRVGRLIPRLRQIRLQSGQQPSVRV